MQDNRMEMDPMSIPCHEKHLGFQECPCGSNEPSWRLYDARGIYCCRVCDQCVEEKQACYRPEIFTNPSYECDEPIDPDE